MKKEEKTVGFDLSTLNLHELIDTYSKIEEFIQFLQESKIEEKENDQDE